MITESELEELIPVVRRYVYRRYPYYDWDDVAQDVIIKIWQKQHQFDESKQRYGRKESLEAWSVTLARYHINAIYKTPIKNFYILNRQTFSPAGHNDPVIFPHPGEESIYSLLVEQLSDWQIELLDLYMEGMTTRGLASYYGMTHRTMARRVKVIKEKYFEITKKYL